MHAPEGSADGAIPGALLLRRPALVAWVVIAVNTFVLQPYWPGAVSGILGDIATCFLFPVLLVASVEWVSWTATSVRRTQWRSAGPWTVGACCGIAVLYCAGLELSASWAGLHRQAMSWLTGMRVTVRARKKSNRCSTWAHCLLSGSQARDFASRLAAPPPVEVD